MARGSTDLGVGLLLSGLLGLAPPALAALQTGPADSTVAGTHADSVGITPFQLDSVTVRILRTPVGLGDVPQSVFVLGADALLRGKALESLEEMMSGIPGVQIQNRFNPAVGERVSVRGFGARAQFGVRGVKVLVDGIPATLADGQSTLDHVDFGSLGRVEVLRGPGSTLYGGAAGGVLDLRSRVSPTAGSLLEATAVTGSDGFWRANGTVRGHATSADYLVSVSGTGSDGFRTNPLESSGDPYGQSRRLQANAVVGAPLAGGRISVVANGVDLDADNPGSLSDSLLALGDRQAFRFNVIQGTGKEVSQSQAGVRWEGPIGSVDLDASVYGIVRRVENPIPNAIIDLDRDAGGARALVRGGSDLLTWSLGGDLDLQSDSRRNFENDGGDAGALTLDQKESVRAAGVFGSTMVHLGRRVTASAGVRYDRTRFEADDRLPDGPDESGSRSLDAVSPSVGVQVQAAPGLGLYANLAKAFITPTTTELANRPDGSGGFNPELEAQASWTLEAGARGRVRGVAYELAAFRTNVDDELVPFEVATDPGRTFFRNAGRSRYQGVEAVLWLRPVGPLTMRATYSYLDAEFRSFTADGDDFSGNAVPGTTPHRFEGLVRGQAGPAFLDLTVEWLGDTPVDDAGRFTADGYAVLDVRFGFQPVPIGGRSLRLAPYAAITNVLDEDYTSSVVVNAFGRRYFEPGPGRRLFVGLSASRPGR